MGTITYDQLDLLEQQELSRIGTIYRELMQIEGKVSAAWTKDEMEKLESQRNALLARLNAQPYNVAGVCYDKTLNRLKEIHDRAIKLKDELKQAIQFYPLQDGLAKVEEKMRKEITDEVMGRPARGESDLYGNPVQNPRLGWFETRERKKEIDQKIRERFAEVESKFLKKHRHTPETFLELENRVYDLENALEELENEVHAHYGKDVDVFNPDTWEAAAVKHAREARAAAERLVHHYLNGDFD